MGVYAGPQTSWINLSSSNSLVGIVTSGLVLALDAGRTLSYSGSGTTWTDLSGNSNNGTLVNTPTYSSADGGYFSFNGTNQYLTSTTAALPSGTDNFTFNIWIYFTSNINGDFGPSVKGCVICSGNAGGTMEFTIFTSSNVAGPPYTISLARYGGGTTGSLSISNIDMPIQRWHNLVLVRDGSASQKVYLNGSLIGTGNVSNSFTAGTFHSGGAPTTPDYDGYLNGRISSILRYNTALTATEVLQNYNASKRRYGIS